MLPKNEKGELTLNTTNLPAGTSIEYGLGNMYAYALRDLSLQAGQTVSYSYILQHTGGPFVKISVEKLNSDILPDIKVHPLDACMKIVRKFMNQNNRSFTETFEDIAAKMKAYLAEIEKTRKKDLDNINKQIKELPQEKNVMQVSGMNKIMETRIPKKVLNSL